MRDSAPRGVVLTTVRVQPTALYENLAMFVVFLVLSGVERFAVKLLRVNSTWLLGLASPQWFAIFGILIGLTIVIVTRAHSADRLNATA
jgi:prolipoprotein diacylglyceryltransferase